MRNIINSADNCAKDKLRVEINSQVQEFLHRGGSIEVLGVNPVSNSYGRCYGKPAAIDEMGLQNADFD